MNFNVVDLLLLAVIILSLINGYRRGFVHGVIDLCGWVLSVLAGLRFYQPVAQWLGPRIDRWPGEFIRPLCATGRVGASARFSPAVRKLTFASRIRSKGSRPSGVSCAKYPRANMSAEWRRATSVSSGSATSGRSPAAALSWLTSSSIRCSRSGRGRVVATLNGNVTRSLESGRIVSRLNVRPIASANTGRSWFSSCSA